MADILLAEDEPILRMLVLDTLEDEGHRIEVACDGEEAVLFAQNRRYDLIILDYMMPKLTGIEVIERLKLRSTNSETKVMMLSAKSQRSEQEKAIAAGADMYVTKPFSPVELIAKVEAMLHG